MTKPSPPRPWVSYAVEALLLIVLIALAAFVVVLVVDLADYQPDRCTIPQSTKHGVTGLGIAVAAAALGAAATSVWRLARGNPSALSAVLGSFVGAVAFFLWAFVAIASGGC